MEECRQIWIGGGGGSEWVVDWFKKFSASVSGVAKGFGAFSQVTCTAVSVLPLALIVFNVSVRFPSDKTGTCQNNNNQITEIGGLASAPYEGRARCTKPRWFDMFCTRQCV